MANSVGMAGILSAIIVAQGLQVAIINIVSGFVGNNQLGDQVGRIHKDRTLPGVGTDLAIIYQR